MDLTVVDIMLHDSPDLAIHRTEICVVWRSQVGLKKVWRLSMQQFNCCTYVAQCALCPAGTKSLPDTLCVSLAAVWCHYGVTKHNQRSQSVCCHPVAHMCNTHFIYHQNFLLCNNNEITTCIADLFNSVCEDVYAVALFKVVQQRTR